MLYLSFLFLFLSTNMTSVFADDSRGGGTVCFSDKILHSILKKATTKTNSCVYA